jgi:hypothetical protein
MARGKDESFRSQEKGQKSGCDPCLLTQKSSM